MSGAVERRIGDSMAIYIVTFIVPAKYEPDIDDPLVFVFADEHEADRFVEHVRALYGAEVSKVSSGIDTYDRAVQWLVEAIGPSEDE